MNYPIAETFRSPQGEGQWVGTYFTFVRFAGCNVGKPYTEEERHAINYSNSSSIGTNPKDWVPQLSVYQEKCQTSLGTTFSCDTNYVMSKKMTVEEIVKECKGVERVCLTGGEPLLHDLHPLCQALEEECIHVHLETSGTKDLFDFKSIRFGFPVYIAVSPKVGCLETSLHYADELKILVGQDFNEEEFVRLYKGHFRKIWLQPINYEHTIDTANMQKCIQLQQKYPLVRLSSQAHKLWNVR
jgi:7-carboxy-7-deazaguanine synthase